MSRLKWLLCQWCSLQFALSTKNKKLSNYQWIWDCWITENLFRVWRNKLTFRNEGSLVKARSWKICCENLFKWGEFFVSRLIIPSKTRNREKGIDKVCCEGCNIKTKQIKEFGTNLNVLRQQSPIEFGQLRSYFIE